MVQTYINNIFVIVSLALEKRKGMKKRWICIYCNKVMDRNNFINVLEESVGDEETHAWRRI